MANAAPLRGTQLLYALTAQAKQYPDAIVMGRGDPDFDTPPNIISAAGAAMQARANDFSPPEGILELRQAIAARMKKFNHVDYDPETEICVTNGGQEAILLMLLATVAPGDELLMQEPNYNTYTDMLKFARGVGVKIKSSVENDFRLDLEALEAAITDKTSAILLVSPNNPGANVVAPADVRKLVDIAVKRDLLILSDEIYDRFIYDDFQHLSPASLPGGKERTLTLNALSKTYAMTGWRVGWVAGPADLMAHVKQLKASVSGPNSVVAQYAGVEALNGPQDGAEAMRQAYIRRRRVVLDALDAMDVTYAMPQGGQFVFADFSFTGMTASELSQRMLNEEHLLVFPGSSFGQAWENYIRITFLQPEDKLAEAMERMKRTVSGIMAERK